jgi:hypothetical protein
MFNRLEGLKQGHAEDWRPLLSPSEGVQGLSDSLSPTPFQQWKQLCLEAVSPLSPIQAITRKRCHRGDGNWYGGM